MPSWRWKIACTLSFGLLPLFTSARREAWRRIHHTALRRGIL